MDKRIRGDRVEERLRALRKSQKWLGGEVGMTQQGIGSIITGQSERPRKLLEIALALETSQEYLLGETDDPAPILSAGDFFDVYAKLSAQDRQTVSALAFHLKERRQAAKQHTSPKQKAPSKRSPRR